MSPIPKESEADNHKALVSLLDLHRLAKEVAEPKFDKVTYPDARLREVTDELSLRTGVRNVQKALVAWTDNS